VAEPFHLTKKPLYSGRPFLLCFENRVNGELRTRPLKEWKWKRNGTPGKLKRESESSLSINTHADSAIVARNIFEKQM
jgi:hypothetical protein